ncbi:PEP-CTERM sorting domain-containing protein [Rubritalea marina]|uniref:PEP-CTERM sorting domain-containing protein n=1 Tax=Rubritalea marina TaxID=361055 RepID=UPI00035E2611|nr:PEP-CTERM sorting domain-containing protein [Rubritalea marina]
MKTLTSLKSVGPIACVASVLVCGSASAVTTQIYQESFEDDSNIYGGGFSPTAADRGYNSGQVFDTANDTNDYWYRSDKTTIDSFTEHVEIGTVIGDYYWAAQDLPDILNDPSPSSIKTLTIEGIDIASQTGLSFAFLVAANPGDTGASTNYDHQGGLSDGLLIEYSIDGGSYQNLLAFRPQSPTSDTSSNTGHLALDTNFDGQGDAVTTLTRAMQEYTANIGSTGTTLDLRFTVTLDGANEYIGIDNIRINADAIPEPSSSMLFGLGALGMIARRKRQ